MATAFRQIDLSVTCDEDLVPALHLAFQVIRRESGETGSIGLEDTCSIKLGEQVEIVVSFNQYAVFIQDKLAFEYNRVDYSLDRVQVYNRLMKIVLKYCLGSS